MKMVHALQENASEGTIQVKQTGVGGDAKIVYALLTGMVSDKVEYPVREIATNAWEVSPPTRPFEIELPTRFNLTYRVRDFGPGLPHRFMMDKYAKIGESTKDNDDDAVGGWGFGSKSPLAYLMRSDGAGAFTVTSRYRGFRRVYSIGVSTNGKIEISFLGEWPLEDEDRGTGLEISFPVRPDDMRRFHDHAKEILWSFHPRPVITPAIDFGQPKVLHSGDGWTVYDRNTVPFFGPQIQLGPVMYAVDMSLAPDSDIIQHDTAIVFNAKIGTISVSASRENLQYDDRTATGLKALFEGYRTNWLAKAREAVDLEPNFFRGYWKAQDISTSLGRQGWGIASQIGWRGFSFNAWLFRDEDPVKVMLRDANQNQLTFKHNASLMPNHLTDRTVVIQHVTSRSQERFEAAGLLDIKCVWVRCKRADLDLVLARMGRPDYVLLDDVKLPKRVFGKREARPEHVKRAKVMDSDLTITSTYVDFTEEHLYVRLYGRGRNRSFRTYVGDNHRHFAFNGYSESRLDSIINTMTSNGVVLDDDFKVIVLDDVQEPEPHWTHLGDHLAELVDAAIDPQQVNPTVPWGEYSFPSYLRDISSHKLDLALAPADLVQLVTDTEALVATRKTLEVEPNTHDKLAQVNLRLTGTDLKSVAKDPTLDINRRWDAILKAYPLLHMLLNVAFRTAWAARGIDAEHRDQINHYFTLLAK